MFFSSFVYFFFPTLLLKHLFLSSTNGDAVAPTALKVPSLQGTQ